MGIQRLSQDLLPYAELGALGTSAPAMAETATIQDLIIDGPSLVYFVYNKLLAWLSFNSVTPTTRTPSYGEINLGVFRVLADIQDHGVSIPCIFFDGGLPSSKREIRLERMEKLRQQLESYRRFHTEFPAATTSPMKDRDFGQALWQTALTSTANLTLPPPPFMVAGVIEALRTSGSQWKCHVKMVPGEADIHCALAAQTSTRAVAVLTNDSDLAVHDLGEMGRLALLQSLERKSHKSVPAGSLLTALCLNPRQIAANLEIPSLLALGFERTLDSSASFAVIRGRTRSASALQQRQDQYKNFAEEFVPSPRHVTPAEVNLEGVDPRTAELLVDMYNSPNIYLTPVVEDPERDSSWTYGFKIRQLSYSLLFTTDSRQGKPEPPAASVVTEHARKGQRIVPTQVTVLNQSDITAAAEELESLLAVYLPPADQSCPVVEATTLLAWQAFAIHLVHKEKVKLNKATPTLTQVVRLFGYAHLTAPPLKTPARVSWDDIHLQANIQAVLYSLRMLYQITGYIVNKLSRCPEQAITTGSQFDDDEKLVNVSRSLHKALSALPPVADLFLDIPDLRRKVSDADIQTRNMLITRLKDVLSSENEPKHATGVPMFVEEESRATDIEHMDGVWITAKWKKKRRKGQLIGLATVSVGSTNSFGLLSEDSG